MGNGFRNDIKMISNDIKSISMQFAAYVAESTFTPHEDIEWDRVFGIGSARLASAERTLLLPQGINQVPEQIGLGSDPTGMWSPYKWLHLLFKDLNLKNKTVCDVGCGIGRLGLYLREMQPKARYLGLEIVPARAVAAREARVNVLDWDVGALGIPQADVYYFYNSLPKPAYERFLMDLVKFRDSGKEFLVVSARDPFDQIKTILTELTKIHIDVLFHHDLYIYCSGVSRPAL